MRVVIVGGSGYIGQCLSRELAETVRPEEIRIFDCAFPDNSSALFASSVTFHKGDVRREEELRTTFKGCDVVFHLAAVGMTGKLALNRPLVDSINVDGTKAVISACLGAGVGRLLYASSVNAIFKNKEVWMATEKDVSYIPPEETYDNYSRTKGEAERLILAANSEKLRTCALRFPGVYGIGETRHQPRIISYIRSGLFVFTYAKGGEAFIQWVNGPNAAQGFRKAMEALGPHKAHVAAGQVYFINDGPPVDSFESFRPLVEVYGTWPTLKMPFFFMLLMAYLMEIFFVLLPALEKLVGFEVECPGATLSEVSQIGITHTYSIAKAKRDLGYAPTNINSFEEVAEFYRKQKEAEEACLPASPRVGAPHKSQWMTFVAGGFAMFAVFVPLLIAILRPLVS